MSKMVYENIKHRKELHLLKIRLNKEIHENIDVHSNKQLILQKKRKLLKEENEQFFHSYSIATSHMKPFSDPFIELKHEYEERGYKIPDLSLNKNLFNTNPLLLDNNKSVQNFYLFTNPKQFTDKHQRYLMKIKEDVENIVGNQGKKEQNRIKELSLSSDTKTIKAMNKRLCLQLKEENEKITEYNQKIGEIIKKKETKNRSRHKNFIFNCQPSTSTELPSPLNNATLSERYYQMNTNSNSINKVRHSLVISDDNSTNYYETTKTEEDIEGFKHYHPKQFIKKNTKIRIDIPALIPSMNIKHQDDVCTLPHKPLNNPVTITTIHTNLKKRKSFCSNVIIDKIFDSKQKFFQYLREINVNNLTLPSLLIIIKEYLKKIKNWKEDQIKQFMTTDSILKEIPRLVVDFNKKISHYDIVGSIPDKDKTIYANKVTQIDKFAKALPKFIIRRMVRGDVCKKTTKIN